MKPLDDDLYYKNEEGKTILTEEYLLMRGYCCSNGCLHCPYDYKHVPEPKRTKLLNERKERNKKKSS
jgi:hypothetical protein